MKTLITILSLFIASQSWAQISSEIQDLLNRYENIPPSTDFEDIVLQQYFSTEEQEKLMAYFKSKNQSVANYSRGELAVDFFYCLNSRVAGNKEFGTLDADPPYDTFNLISETFTRLKADDIAADGLLYTVNRDTFELVTVSFDDGGINVIGELSTILPGDFVAGMSYNFTNDEMYLLVSNGGFTSLFQVNLENANMTLITTVSLSNPFWLVIDNQGNGWTVSNTDDTLYQIDLTNGNVTPSPNPLGVDLSFSQDATYDHEGETLIMAGYQGGGVGGIYTIDTDTGIANLIGETTPLEYAFSVFSANNGALSTLDFDPSNTAIWPNPTKGIVNFDLNNETEVETIAVYDNMGRVILESFMSSQIDLSNVEAGVYYVQIKTLSKQTFVKRIVKQ